MGYFGIHDFGIATKAAGGHAANIILRTEGVTRVHVSPTGEVGIGGVGFPGVTLRVSGTISATGPIQVGTSGLTCSNGIPGAIRYNSGKLEYCNGSDSTVLASSAAAEAAADRIVSGTTIIITAHEDRSLTFATAGTQRAVIDERGYIGIGVDTPIEMLHMRGGNLLMDGSAHPSLLLFTNSITGDTLSKRSSAGPMLPRVWWARSIS